MNFIRFRFILFLVAVGLIFTAHSAWYKAATGSPVFAQTVSHPFLIVRSDQYQALRDRVATEPWLGMKTRAISDAATLTYDPNLDIYTRSLRMKDVASANALAYILDSTNSATYKNKIRDTLMSWDTITPALNCADWNATVPPADAFLNSVLALDITSSDLTLQELTDIEAKLDAAASWYYANNCSWQPAVQAVRGIWALYKGDRPNLDAAKLAYKSSHLASFTTDSVYKEGPNYAWARLGMAEDSKTYFMDVLEFTGEDTYYTDPQFIKFYEWLYRGSLTPNRKGVTFGDSDSEFLAKSNVNNPATFRAYKFSALAAKNAAWVNQTAYAPKGRLLTYVLYDQPLPPPEKPLSTIWPDGMASFWENNPSDTSLMGALWNPKSAEGHSHKDVNAIHLTAYGEHILRNSGYAGWGLGCTGATWTYVHDTAVSSNTVLIDGQDHALKYGNGITEGFTTASLFDYASADSGSALPNGKQVRNLVFIHPQDNKNGYFTLFDEVATTNKHASINVALHPNSAFYTTVSPSQEFSFTVSQYTGQNVFANIFLATTPSTVEIKDGALCNKSTYPSLLGKYVYSTYSTNSGKKNIVSVIFPSDTTHAKATMTRVSGSGYTGLKVDHGNSAIDAILESAGTNTINFSGASFRGLAIVFSKSGTNTSFYFVRKGKNFNDGNPQRQGFDSSTDISLYLKQKIGNVVSPGTNVTLYYPGIVGVELNGNVLINLSAGSGWVKVPIPAGTYALEIL